MGIFFNFHMIFGGKSTVTRILKDQKKKKKLLEQCMQKKGLSPSPLLAVVLLIAHSIVKYSGVLSIQSNKGMWEGSHCNALKKQKTKILPSTSFLT